MYIVVRVINTHAPAKTSYTNFQLYYFAIHICYTNRLEHGQGYERHSSEPVLHEFVLLLSIMYVSTNFI